MCVSCVGSADTPNLVRNSQNRVFVLQIPPCLRVESMGYSARMANRLPDSPDWAPLTARYLQPFARLTKHHVDAAEAWALNRTMFQCVGSWRARIVGGNLWVRFVQIHDGWAERVSVLRMLLILVRQGLPDLDLVYCSADNDPLGQRHAPQLPVFTNARNHLFGAPSHLTVALAGLCHLKPAWLPLAAVRSAESGRAAQALAGSRCPSSRGWGGRQRHQPASRRARLGRQQRARRGIRATPEPSSAGGWRMAGHARRHRRYCHTQRTMALGL